MDPTPEAATHTETETEPRTEALPTPVISALPGFEAADDETVSPELLSRRICDFDLKIEGRPLGKVIERFIEELHDRGITKLQPAFYLSDEWGVPEGSVAIGIPFYLADVELLKVQERRGGIVEGTGEEDILRYLRHEMGHVVNYAYRLYTTEEWTQLFGPMARPYTEEYRAVPFSPDFVRHLPGSYAQKHPDEDWAETFAVWLTPGLDWRALYADSPRALAKLEYTDREISALKDAEPLVTTVEIDTDVRDIKVTVQEYFGQVELGEMSIPRSLDGDLQTIFSSQMLLPAAPGEDHKRLGSAAQLLRRQRDRLANVVYFWTSVDPSIVRQVILHLEKRAKEMNLSYPLAIRDTVVMQLTGCLATLAMNYVYKSKLIAT